MTIRRRLIALAALSLLVVPNAALADDNKNGKDKCDVPASQQDEDCKKRPGSFQTRFFSE